MASQSLTIDSKVQQLRDAHEAGHGLAHDFYVDRDIYDLEMDSIWRSDWVFAGLSCELPTAGDYITLPIGSDSIIIVRGDGDELRAFHNICRHRGIVLCDQPHGHVGRIVCPYHQWTYSRDGKLVTCRGMDEDLDKAALGMFPVHLECVDGMVFICLAEDPPDITPARELLGPQLRPQGLHRSKVAAAVEYEIAANWKLVWENNRECYHCNVNHPQYIKANYDHYNVDDTPPRALEQIEAATDRLETTAAANGLAITHRKTGMVPFPDVSRGIWYSANRTALAQGWLSESLDGKQVAPLMGDYQSPDVGTLRVRTMPNMWNHSSCDHVVSTRLLPGGPRKTLARVVWFVDEAAEEGIDYDPKKLMPFWQLTSEQDWELCERAQRGVESTAYRPGPLSTYKEYNVDAFVQWYLQSL